MSTHKLIIKDAFWQILGRVISALGGFLVVKLMTPYFGPLRYGDYSTILKYFAIWSAFADFGLYVIALRRLGELKDSLAPQEDMEKYYGKFVMSRFTTITIVYTVALVLAYFIPAYTSNPYLVRGLPLGMVFSASFMIAGILQLPLQLYRGMKHVSIALTVARIAQIITMVLVVTLYRNIDFSNGDTRSVISFILMIATVIVSAVVQGLYVWIVGNKHIKLKLVPDWAFTRRVIVENWQYGLAYCLSSLHTLGVMILLGIYFPTVDKFDYVGMWAVASALMEILLIVPSSLGNSIIHKVTSYSVEKMRAVFGSLLLFVVWIGGIFLINFSVFPAMIIRFVSGVSFLSSHTGGRGSDTILPWLAIVLFLGFIKQVYNFLFVALHLNNRLLRVNGIGVLLGAIVGCILIPKYGIAGGIITQMLMEFSYGLGGLYTAWKYKAPLIFSWKYMFGFLAGIVLFIRGGRVLVGTHALSFRYCAALGVILNAVILALSYKPLKVIMRGFNLPDTTEATEVANAEEIMP